MSWQQYVDANLVGSGKLTRACIVGLDGSIWATSKGFNIAPTESRALIQGFRDSTPLRASGLHVGGQKYFVLRADDRSIYAKLGQTGLSCVKTNQCVIVGYYDDRGIPGEANTVVESMADYLISVGY